MDAVQVDPEGRIRLGVLNPGDYYEPTVISQDVITLRRVATPDPRRTPSAATVKRSILDSTVDLGVSYDEVRALTREP